MKLPWAIALAIAVSVGFMPKTRAQTINLGTAARFGILAGSAVTNSGGSVVTGDVGVSPGTAVTGFAGFGAGGFGIVNGSIYSGDGVAAQAEFDLGNAYTAAQSQLPTVTSVTSFANTTLTPGVYNSSTSLSLSGTITLDGRGQADPEFIFQIGTTFDAGAGSQIVLINGATAQDIFWQVGTSATLGAAAQFSGTILASASIDAAALARIDGRLLAENGAVTLNDNQITAVPEPPATALVLGSCAALAAISRILRRRPSFAIYEIP